MNIKNCKGKRLSSIQTQTNQNYTQLVNENPESQKVVERCATHTKRSHVKVRLLYIVKISITIDEENKTVNDKSRFKQYLSTNPALKKVLEEKF